MTKSGIRIVWVEIATLALLLLKIYWPAFSLTWAGIIPLLHALFLLGAYALLRHQAGMLHKAAGSTMFALVTCLLLIEITINHFTGLHLNRFILSMVAQPQALEHIGISSYLVALLAIFGGVAFAVSWRLGLAQKIALRPVLVASVTCFLVSQSIYAYLIYQRSPALIHNEPNVPFFEGIHHYYADRLFEPILGASPTNPFGASFDDQPRIIPKQSQWEPRTPRNVLLVVIDSLRGADIAENPSVAPNLTRWASRGHFSLSHNSVANCTHFSMHTLFTGQLPVNFGEIRRAGAAMGLFAALNGTGYRLQSTEAFPLDWYDLARTYMPGVERTIVRDAKGGRDAEAVATALAGLPGTSPWFHLLYLNGPHFPYDTAPGDAFTVENYRRVLTETDALVGTLLDGLQAQGILDSTLVIITSDHGEEVLENGVIGHGTSLSGLQTEVPLLILGAKQPTSWIRSHQDIMPYIRAELGAAPLRAIPQGTDVRVRCDYEYPSSYALREQGGEWIEFHYKGGLISPVIQQGKGAPSEKSIRRAGLKLIDLIKGPKH